jgi:DNA polymerase III epsilon subunit-like protein
MKEKLLAFIDTELSGRNFDLHEILSIGLVLVREKREAGKSEFEELGEWEWKIKPIHIHTAEPESLKINHFDPSLWLDAKPLCEVLVEFLEKVTGAMLVGQNTAFDLGFIEHALHAEELSRTYHYHSLDTVSLAMAILRDEPKLQTFSLHELTKYFGITHENTHTALSDAKATYEVYKKLMNI